MEQWWFDFPGYEDRYEIARDGAVRSKSRRVNSPAAGGSRWINGRALTPVLVKGYPALQPKTGGKQRTAYIHRAIATLFVPNPDGKPDVNHKDGNRQNNDPANLEWCTHQENMAHAFRTGLAKPRDIGPGERSPSAKLTDKDVLVIRDLVRQGIPYKAIATNYGISSGTIGFIARRETWKHLP